MKRGSVISFPYHTVRIIHVVQVTQCLTTKEKLRLLNLQVMGLSADLFFPESFQVDIIFGAFTAELLYYFSVDFHHCLKKNTII